MHAGNRGNTCRCRDRCWWLLMIVDTSWQYFGAGATSNRARPRRVWRQADDFKARVISFASNYILWIAQSRVLQAARLGLRSMKCCYVWGRSFKVRRIAGCGWISPDERAPVSDVSFPLARDATRGLSRFCSSSIDHVANEACTKRAASVCRAKRIGLVLLASGV